MGNMVAVVFGGELTAYMVPAERISVSCEVRFTLLREQLPLPCIGKQGSRSHAIGTCARTLRRNQYFDQLAGVRFCVCSPSHLISIRSPATKRYQGLACEECCRLSAGCTAIAVPNDV